MPDLLDHASDLENLERDASIANAVAAIPKPSLLCRSCRESVGLERFAAGCCRCMECQVEHETRERINGRR